MQASAQLQQHLVLVNKIGDEMEKGVKAAADRVVADPRKARKQSYSRKDDLRTEGGLLPRLCLELPCRA